MDVNPYQSPQVPQRPHRERNAAPPRQRPWALWLLAGLTVFLFFTVPAFQVMTLDVKVCLVTISLFFLGFAVPAARGIRRQIALVVTLVFLVFCNYDIITYPMARPHRRPPQVAPSQDKSAPAERVPAP
jgi:hypothetical protein